MYVIEVPAQPCLGPHDSQQVTHRIRATTKRQMDGGGWMLISSKQPLSAGPGIRGPGGMGLTTV